MSPDWRDEVCNFWFCLGQDRWFNGDPTLDLQVKQKFVTLWAAKRQLPVESFLDEPLTALAGIILFDQFPRNMFRGNAEQFATDNLAVAIAKAAIDKGFDEQFAPDKRAFIYLPFEHSEDIADQNRSILLFTALADPRYLRFAKLHHDIVQRFGRFPHRNVMLGRAPRTDEEKAGDVVPW
ncbi:MAG TPA: DUF924 family protein [Sphingomicrobium sp.]|nr:DUF924 family protein [Sphingomicrobium sp.]